ncbi:hypothetical protein BV898_18787 [Hypsibius exemplaris]|uniref:NHR domain-containing protein n=1 Tax=Hypsibius exemplaris TaxID=2072580 RepID=A0A9X6NKK6_HYPEX|nr:hypothetical protein BV898_18787 [Hypsibius exemplaris]
MRADDMGSTTDDMGTNTTEEWMEMMDGWMEEEVVKNENFVTLNKKKLHTPMNDVTSAGGSTEGDFKSGGIFLRCFVYRVFDDAGGNLLIVEEATSLDRSSRTFRHLLLVSESP